MHVAQSLLAPQCAAVTALEFQHLPAVNCRKVRTICLAGVQPDVLKATVASALLTAVLVATPVFAKAPSAEYISVQDRVQQRSPRLQRQPAQYNSSEASRRSSTLSIPQQAGVASTSSAAVLLWLS